MKRAQGPQLRMLAAMLSACSPPMLLVASSGDTVVRPRNAEALAAALRAVGATVETRNYGGLSHANVVMALSRPFRGKAPVLDDSVAFLRREMTP